jgi:lipopolysaccharide transport system ATP-binding protein
MESVDISSDLAGTAVPTGSHLMISVKFRTDSERFRPVLGIVVKTATGAPVFGIDNRTVPGYEFAPVCQGRISCRVDSLPLMPGRYLVDLYLGDEHRSRDMVREAVQFDVIPSDYFGSGKLPPPSTGPICLPARWQFSENGASARALSGQSR